MFSNSSNRLHQVDHFTCRRDCFCYSSAESIKCNSLNSHTISRIGNLSTSLVIFTFLWVTLTADHYIRDVGALPSTITISSNKYDITASSISGATSPATPASQIPNSSAKSSLTPKLPQESITSEQVALENNHHNYHHQQHNRWIENILVRVAGLNLNGERNPFGPVNIDQDQNSTISSTTQLQLDIEVPTEVGEDPLEATLAAATPTTISSQLVDESSNGLPGVSVETPSQQQSTSVTSNRDNESDEDNKLSPLSAQSPVSSSPPSNQLPNNDQISTTQRPVLTCEQAYTQCALRKVCAPALRAYNEDCRDLMNNKTATCSPKCLKAMIALRSSEEGDDLVQCDCQGHEFCLQSKQRSLTCRPQVEEAVDPKTIVSCSIASWICLADQLCSTALEYYHRNCQSLFTQRLCSSRCNNSLAILYRQPKANKLITCQCDGSEEFPCVRYKTYTERFCLNKQTPLPVPNQPNAPLVAFDDEDSLVDSNETNNHRLVADAGEQQLVGTEGDDKLDSDLANEQMMSTSSGDVEGDAQTYDDSNDGPEDDDNNGNGIRAPTSMSPTGSDEWIPLMSGRYFTNLQIQQQLKQHLERKKQQQQQLTTIRGKQQSSQRLKGERQHKSHGSTSASGASNTSGGNPEFQHHKRSRHNRILASTFSSQASNSGRINIFCGLNTIVTIVALMMLLVAAVVIARSNLSRGFIMRYNLQSI